MESYEFKYPELRMGQTGTHVKIMQHLILVRGSSLPRYGCDGDFGAETAGALRYIQSKAGLTRDAICGIHTWIYLLTGEVTK